MAKQRRITGQELEEAVQGLSAVTGKNFQVTYNATGKGYDLSLHNNGGVTVLETAVSSELYNWVKAYQAGFEEGMSKGPPMPTATPPVGRDLGTLRAFKGTFFVTIDPADSNEDEPPTVTIEALRDHLSDLVCLDLDFEEVGNPLGVSSVALYYDTMQEMSPEEVKKYYG